MQSEKSEHPGAHEQTYGSVLKEVSSSVKNLVQSEVDLIKAEIQESSQDLGKSALLAFFFGALLVFIFFLFIVFLFIGLGKLRGENFWFSSLFVGGGSPLIGGIMI